MTNLQYSTTVAISYSSPTDTWASCTTIIITFTPLNSLVKGIDTLIPDRINLALHINRQSHCSGSTIGFAIGSSTIGSPTIGSSTINSPAIRSSTISSPAIRSSTINSPTISSPAIGSSAIGSSAINSPASIELDIGISTGYIVITIRYYRESLTDNLIAVSAKNA